MSDPHNPRPPDQPMQRGPNSHRMDAPSDVTTWTVIRTTRNVVADDGQGMTLRDEWWEVPSFVVEEIERSRAMTGDTLRAAVDAACDLTNPRLSEVDWDNVAAAIRSVGTPPASRETLDVERLRDAIYAISVRHDWEHTTDREDRTAEIAAEYQRLAREQADSEPTE